jgi:alkanesulfonate monooxygenase SsuD/methylene tetrahydromethanopterin reductase-like flavin-dependent oxidoreductase (luciferase family)
VLESDQTSSSVSQYHRGIEIVASIDGPLEFRRGMMRCSLRTVSQQGEGFALSTGPTRPNEVPVASIPPGFVGLSSAPDDALLAAMKAEARLYWLVALRDHARCVEWRFKSSRARQRAGKYPGYLVRRQPILDERTPMTASFSFEYDANLPEKERKLVLFGPHFHRKGQSLATPGGGYRCGIGYGFVGATDSALRMLPGGPPGELIAWHPDDEEHWYLREQDCLDAARSASEFLVGSPEGDPPGGVHIDCFDELVENLGGDGRVPPVK